MMTYNHFAKTLKILHSVLFTAAVSCFLVACASTPPSKTLPQSKIAVESINHANYQKHVKNEIEAVKQKLKDAKAFEVEKQHILAEQLAQQILVDVELIRIKTQRLIVEQEVKEIEHSVRNLNEELKWREPIQVAPLNK